jgi:uncharacterized membrane protein
VSMIIKCIRHIIIEFHIVLKLKIKMTHKEKRLKILSRFFNTLFVIFF